jgi:NAD(P)H-hydrate epimerase
MEAKLTEVMTIPYRDTSEGSFGMQDLEGMLDMIASSTVSVIGPGISRQYETQNLVRKLVARATRPLVVDADALYAMAGHLDILLGVDNEIVLTPHTGEFSRMIDQSIAEIEAKRVELARTFATEFSVTLVLKGAPTIIATKEGQVYINATGNPGMATAGSGDVLTGVIAGLIAQGSSAVDAALCGVYLHGMAGDLARKRVGEYGLIATDMLTAVAETIHELGAAGVPR